MYTSRSSIVGKSKSAVVSLVAASACALLTLHAAAQYLDTNVNEKNRQLNEQDYEDGESQHSHKFSHKDLTSIVALVLYIVFLTVLFEWTKEWLHHRLSALSDMQLLLEKLYGELTILGFISMFCFALTESGLMQKIALATNQNEHALVEHLECVHYTIFCIMILFLIQVLVLGWEAASTEQTWLDYDFKHHHYQYHHVSTNNSSSNDKSVLNDTHITPEENAAFQCMRHSGWAGRILPFLIPKNAEKVRDAVIFRALKREFLLERSDEPPFAPTNKAAIRNYSFDDEDDSQNNDDITTCSIRGFKFGRYLSLSQTYALAHVVEVEAQTWLYFSAAIVLFYIVALLLKPVHLAWLWVLIGWLVYAFHVAFERHLQQLLYTFLPKYIVSAIEGNDDKDPTGVEKSYEGHAFTLYQENDTNELPSWCSVDIDYYIQYQRSKLVKWIVGGVPSRQQVNYWFDRHGPHMYLLILQSNLLFVGIYAGLLLLTFIPLVVEVYQGYSIPIYSYIVISMLPVITITWNKKRTVALLTQVCSIGPYRKTQVVAETWRIEKTYGIVRTFLVVYKMRQYAMNSSSIGSEANNETGSQTVDRMRKDDKQAEAGTNYKQGLSANAKRQISFTFKLQDTDGDGKISALEIKQFFHKLGIPTSTITSTGSTDDSLFDRILAALDYNGDGIVTKDEFVRWYASQIDQPITLDEVADELFDMFDVSGNGEITISEFTQRIDALSMGFTIKEIGAIMQELDYDCSGSVSKDEWRSFIEKYFPRELCHPQHSTLR